MNWFAWLFVVLFSLLTSESQPPQTQFHSPTVLGTTPPVIENRKDLERFNNHLVTIKGNPSQGKIQTILGVEVKFQERVSSEGEWYAVGILRQFEVTSHPAGAADRGPGIRYMLYSDLRGTLSIAADCRLSDPKLRRKE